MSKPEQPRKALGRGMGALLPTRAHTPPPAVALPPPSAPVAAEPRETPLTVPIDSIHVNPLQPRRHFQHLRLEELAQSIRSNGIIQPLVVRKVDGQYHLVAGERRWRAAKLAEVAEVPVVVREIPEDRLLEITLIENIQREDLSAIETAYAFTRMMTDLHLNADEIGRRTGKDRSTILNTVRLLQLPEDVQTLITEGKLSAGHGRALLGLPTFEAVRQLAKKVLDGGWSVRQTEQARNKLTDENPPEKPQPVKIDPNVKAAVNEMERKLGTRVHVIEGAKGKGKIEIHYYSAEDLDRIYDAIMGEP
ncbi:MAG: ParB/RepB/Spo0J family partition protein [Candidatus Solibacter sp.]